MSSTRNQNRSQYDLDHGIDDEEEGEAPSRRQDYATFWSNIHQMDTSQNNTNTELHPSDVSAVARLLANSYQVQLGETEGVVPNPNARLSTPQTPEMLERMIRTLMELSENPTTELQGVPEDFMANLERVARSDLEKRHEKATETEPSECPICAVPFMEDKYPLVVRLPCHHNHIFDLDCIGPWLKLNVTCPLCRTEVYKEESKEEKFLRQTGVAMEKEEEYDDWYA